jgi:hypothetical protein
MPIRNGGLWIRAAALLGAGLLALVLGGPLGCGDQLPLTYSGTGVSLLVVNSTCVDGPCDSLRVIGFPSGGPSATVNWMVELGTVTGPSGCLTIPPMATYGNIVSSNDGQADTIVYQWTPARAMWLGAVTPSSPPPPFWSPSTQAFVPARALGWSAALPDSAGVQPAIPCTPGAPSN